MNYSDKIFEMLNIEPDEEFYVEYSNGNCVECSLTKSLNCIVKKGSTSMLYGGELLRTLLNGEGHIHKIIKPTKEEQIAIDYAKICGCKWLAADYNGLIYGYRTEKPKKGEILWSNGYDAIPLLVPFSFIHWEDEEPYYIEK